MAVAAISVATRAMITISLREDGIGKIGTAVSQDILIAGLQTMNVRLGGFSVFLMTPATGPHGISTHFAYHPFVSLFFVIGVRCATMAGNTTDLGVDIPFQVFFITNENFLPYLQRR